MNSRNSMLPTAALLALLIHAAPTQAANILWVDSASTSGGAGVDPASGWTTLLETTGGHTVTTFDGSTYNWDLSTQADLDYVNGFDVAIVQNSNNTFNAIRTHGAAWNALATPMINLNPYLLSGQYSSATWQWGTAEGGTPGGVDNALAVDAPADPVWTGMTLNLGPTAPDLYDAASRYYDYDKNNIGASLLPGVAAVASNPSDSTQLAIAYAAPGSLQSGGAAQYFFATNGGDEPFTSDGETAFLNAIDALAIPEPGSLALLGLGGLTLLRRRRA